jgi:hypothetical protein
MPLRVASLLAISAALLAAAAPASATTAQEAVQFLNQQREANQIPAGLAVDADRTKGCKNHNHYMALNNGLEHGEQPGNPGYTDEGANVYNGGEVLAQGEPDWSASTNPWDAAPLHQTILFHPSSDSAGYDASEGFSCMRVHYVFQQAPAPAFYAYTSNTGRVDVPPSVTVQGEGPYAPQEAVGIQQGVTTGPNILFFVDGFGSTNHATSFSLTGPGGGAVETKMVDSTTQPPDGNTYKAFQTGGDLIAVNPLDAFTDYTATVMWHNDDTGAEMQQTVSFKTSGFLRGLNNLTLSAKLARGRKTTLKAPAEAVGQKATVKISTRKRGRKAKAFSTKQITLKRSQKVKLPKKPGKGGAVIVKVTVPTFTLGDTRFTVTPATRTYR